MNVPAPALAPDLEAALKRLKLARIRAIAPEVLQTAKTQRWTPEETLRTLVDAELAARDEANQATRLKTAAFPVIKALDAFQVHLSAMPQATFQYLGSLEWLRAAENLCLIGPPGTGKSHVLLGLGYAAVVAGYRVCYFVAAALIETLYRGLADNAVGRVIDQLLRAHLVIVWSSSMSWALCPSMPSAHSSSSASWPRPTSGAAWALPATRRLSTGVTFYRNRPPLQHCSTACCTTQSWSSPKASPTGCAKRAREGVASARTPERPGVGTFVGHQRGLPLGH